MAPIQRLLVANRGEIACRIIGTARRMGIHTIAVYSSADSHARHVDMADEAVWIGDPLPSDSYLNVGNILAAATSTQADAIHSGYGFLSENADFAAACIEQGLTFVGPPPDAIRAMGMKGSARQLMEDAGVPVLPGINAIEGDITEAAADIGYPLLIKPAAGGGGKGMKVVNVPQELDEALASARREAKSAFANDSLMAEKYLRAPRHVEVQIFADQQGHCIHLNERDCSLQRRHQKIIEESPAPGMTSALRTEMGNAAIVAATAIGYVGAGTVEFLLGADNRFYFMEMNTRLQVEHPVTEAVTGFDLVEWQLNVAAGKPLPVTQREVPLHGHAIEARLYAEDPLNDFLPVAGRIERLELPVSEDVRIDSGIQQGDQVGVYYDPMLMKLIAWGDDRTQAIDRLRNALAELQVIGIRTNRDFLCHMLDYSPFRQGALSTDFLDQHLAEVFTVPSELKTRAHTVAAVMALEQATAGDLASPWRANRNFRLNSRHAAVVSIVLDDRRIDIDIEQQGYSMRLTFDDKTSIVNILEVDESSIALVCDNLVYRQRYFRFGHRLTIISHSRVYDFTLPVEEANQGDAEGNVQAPMSGRIAAIIAEAGQQVQKGAALVVIEAMKMEHTVRAPADGTVHTIHFTEGELVEEGCELLEFEPASP